VTAAIAVLEEATRLGLTLRAEAGRIVARPKEGVTSEFAAVVEAHRADVLALLAAAVPPPTAPCGYCRGTRFFARSERLTWFCARCNETPTPKTVFWYEIAASDAGGRAIGAEAAITDDVVEPACARVQFLDRPDGLVARLCYEPSHRHPPTPGEVVFDSTECDLVVAWARHEGVQRLSRRLRDSLIDIKSAFGGRVAPETVASFGAAIVQKVGDA
jgi:hypothetical protein